MDNDQLQRWVTTLNDMLVEMQEMDNETCDTDTAQQVIEELIGELEYLSDGQ